jgi:hypothetical protein
MDSRIRPMMRGVPMTGPSEMGEAGGAIAPPLSHFDRKKITIFSFKIIWITLSSPYLQIFLRPCMMRGVAPIWLYWKEKAREITLL